MLKGLITAIRTLTILPIPGKDAANFSASLYWFALIGALLGSILYGLARLIHYLSGDAWPQGAAVIILLAGIVLTRGLHLDGLADFADAFWGTHQREKTLAIMKDSFVGAFGIVALVILLLTKWMALVRLFESQQTVWIITSTIVSRSVMVELATVLPYPRETGTAKSFVDNAGIRHRLINAVLAIIFVVLISNLLGLLVLFGGWLFSRIFGFWCAHRVGGITGDLLGACCEMTETLILFSLAWFII